MLEMNNYIGVKLVKGAPMPRGDYNLYRGWITPANENPNAPGYLVEYQDSNNPCHPDHEGYISWSPADVFEDTNRPTNGMTYGMAIEAMKKGYKVARAGWNGKNMFVVLMPSMYLPPANTQDTARKVNDRTAKWIGEDAPLDCQGYFAMYNAKKKWQPGWLATQSDSLADDWMIIE